MTSLLPTRTAPASPHATHGRTICAGIGRDNDTVPPPLTSGFGTVMEREYDLQALTRNYVGTASGPHAAAIDRILRVQQEKLGANIALLGERYETLPHPVRFDALRRHPAIARTSAEAEPLCALPALVAQHLGMLGNINTLIAQREDGERGELILTEVARNHEEMAWMLTALLKEDESVRDRLPLPVTATAPAAGSSEAGWENEGGAPRA